MFENRTNARNRQNLALGGKKFSLVSDEKGPQIRQENRKCLEIKRGVILPKDRIKDK